MPQVRVFVVRDIINTWITPAKFLDHLAFTPTNRQGPVINATKDVVTVMAPQKQIVRLDIFLLFYIMDTVIEQIMNFMMLQLNNDRRVVLVATTVRSVLAHVPTVHLTLII